MIQWIAAALAGAVAGVFTGLIPGIHVNTVTALLLAVSAGLASLGVEYTETLAFTCALAISHTFFDVVPGLFLGVPGDEAFAQLPGHRLVKRGEGEAAIRLSVAGSLIGLALGLPVMVVPALGGAIGGLEGLVRPAMFLVLASVSAILILTERRKGWSLFAFLVSGLLGVAVFASPLVAGGSDAPVNALFPSLAGLFGVAGLLFAIATAAPLADRPRPPPPERAPRPSPLPDPNPGPPAFAARLERIATRLKRTSAGRRAPRDRAALGASGRRIVADGGVGGVAGLLVGLLPGLGAANAATLLLLLQRFVERATRWRRGGAAAAPASGDDPADARSYLVTTSSLNTSEALFAIAALYVIQRSRSGASIAVERILGGDVLQADLLPMAAAMAIAGGVAAAIMWFSGPRLAAIFASVDETGLNWSVVAFLVVLTALLLGLGGLTILAVATAVGVVPLLTGVRRAQLMGFFLLPALLFFSGRQEALVALLPIEQRTAPLAPALGLAGIAGATLGAVAAGALVHFALRRRAARRSRAPSGKRMATACGLAIAGALALALAGVAYPGPGPLPPPEPVSRAHGRIAEAIDGDTFRMASLGRRFRVRLKGVDAPETSTEEGRAAARAVADRFEGESVTWQPLSVDAYGRLVADVHLVDGLFVNAEIVRMGHARVVRDRPSEHRDALARLEDEARREGRGLWGASSDPSAPRPAESDPSSPALERWDDDGNGRISCAEARGHGIAPVRRGHPAYPYMRDANADGVVCA